jgi:hypothetical protein
MKQKGNFEALFYFGIVGHCSMTFYTVLIFSPLAKKKSVTSRQLVEDSWWQALQI